MTKLYSTAGPLVLILLLIAGCAVTVKTIPSDVTTNGKITGEDVYFRILKAHYLSFSGHVDEGLTIFRESLKDYPDNSELFYQYAKFLLDLSYRTNDQQNAEKLVSTARDALIRSSELDDTNIVVKTLLADVRIELGELAEAIDLLERIMEMDPSNQKVKTDLARLYVHTHSPEKAVRLLKPVIETQELTNYELLKVYALACGESNLLEDSIEMYKRYLALFPGEFEASYNLSLCYFRSGQFLHANEILERLKSQGQLTLEVAELYTDVLKGLGRVEEAIQLLREISKNPRYEIGSFIEIGQLLLSSNDAESAYQYLIKAVIKAPNDRRATFYTAVALNEMDRYDEAIRMLDNNLEDKPISIASADLAVDIFLRLKQVNSVLAICQRLINERSKDVRVWLIVARAYESLDMPDKALEILTQGTLEFPLDVSLNMALAFRLEEKGEWKEAIRIADKLYLQHSDSPEISNFIGYVLADRNEDLPRALKLIQAAVSIEPENSAYLDSLAWVYFRMGRMQDAYEQISKANQSMPDDPLIIEHFIRICIGMNVLDEAGELLDGALIRFPDSPGLNECRDLLNNAFDQ
ncbi:tetratricopeptide repeat protein [bacterium]|nr:tetratricopeptide repeat protein [candidate division CSSED10-310 bacterium]